MNNPYQAPETQPKQAPKRGTSIRFWVVISLIFFCISAGLKQYRRRLEAATEAALQQQKYQQAQEAGQAYDAIEVEP